MSVIKIQLHQEVRRYVDVNIQLNRIYNFIFKKFENVPSYFQLQYRHPSSRIRRQLCDNEQLTALLSLKPTITLLIRPLHVENISRYQISRTCQIDICNLLDNLSLQQQQQQQQQQQLQQQQEPSIQQPLCLIAPEEHEQNNIRVIQDNSDFLIKDETNQEYDETYNEIDDTAQIQQIEIIF